MKEEYTYEEKQRNLEEQRRLFYVAITRASKRLIISSVKNLPRNLAHKMGVAIYNRDDFTGETRASQFISELGPQCPRAIMGKLWLKEQLE